MSFTLRLGSRFGKYLVRDDDKQAAGILRRHNGQISAKKDLDAGILLRTNHADADAFCAQV